MVRCFVLGSNGSKNKGLIVDFEKCKQQLGIISIILEPKLPGTCFHPVSPLPRFPLKFAVKLKHPQCTRNTNVKLADKLSRLSYQHLSLVYHHRGLCRGSTLKISIQWYEVSIMSQREPKQMPAGLFEKGQ